MVKAKLTILVPTTIFDKEALFDYDSQLLRNKFEIKCKDLITYVKSLSNSVFF